MNDPISREELKAIIETQSKATEQMVLVAKSLSDILIEQKKITDKLSNGFVKDLSDKCKENGALCSSSICRNFEKALEPFTKYLPEIKEAVTTTKQDSTFLKWFVGSIGIIIVIATVILRGIDTRIMWGKADKQATYDTTKIIEAIHETESSLHKQ